MRNILFLSFIITLFLPLRLSVAAEIKTSQGLSGAKLEREIIRLSAKGYQLSEIKGYTVNNKIYYATIWSASASIPSRVLYGLSETQLEKENKKQKSEGYQLGYLTGYNANGKEAYAAIWHKQKNTGLLIHYGLDLKALKDKYQELQPQGYQLVRISGHGIKGQSKYTVSWSRADNPNQRLGVDMTEAAYAEQSAELKARGYGLTYVAGFQVAGAEKYAAVWSRRAERDQVVQLKLNSRNLQSALANNHYIGNKLKTISGYAIGKRAHFIAMWENGHLSSDDQGHINGTVKAFMDKYQVPGMAIAITKKGKLVYAKGFGFSRKKPILNASPLHRFRIGSVSKSLTSLAVMKLVQDGKLGLDDKVFGKGAILGARLGSKPYGDRVKKITVRHLLEHTGGGAGWNNNNKDGTEDPTFSNPGLNQNELIGWVLDNRSPDAEPGKKYSYSNFGYSVLGRVIEKKSGMRYSKYIKKYILRPAGIRRMLIAHDQKKKKRSNEAVYYGDEAEDPYVLNMRRIKAHAGWIASPIDLVRLMVHVDGYDSKRDIISADMIRTMTTGSTANKKYALGWAVNENNDWRHNGGLPGSYATVVRTSGEYCWAVLTNSRSAKEGFGEDFDKLTWDIIAGVKSWPDHDLF